MYFREMMSCSISAEEAHLGNGEALVDRVVGSILILMTSMIGFSFALYAKGKWKPMVFIFRAFSAGIVLATAFTHVLADASTALHNPCLGLGTSFPWSNLVALLSTLTTFMGEYLLEGFMYDSWKRKSEAKRLEECKDSELPGDETEEEAAARLERQMELSHRKVVAYTLESGIVFHSIFIGIGLGASRHVKYVRTLSIAIIFHQGFEGISLATALCRAEIKFFYMLVLGAVFSLVTPVGIYIGIALGSSYNANGKSSLAMEGFLNAFSAGILIYNGLVDLIIPTFDRNSDEGPKTRLLTVLGFLALYTGAASMSVIAKWA